MTNKMPRPRALAALLVAGGFICGCNADPGIFIRHAATPDPAEQCYAANDPSGAQIAMGSLDVDLLDTYFADLVVGNRRTGTSDAVQLYEASVEVFDSGLTIDSFTQPVAGFVQPRDGSDFGLGVTRALLLTTPTLAKALANHPKGAFEVVARVFVSGQTLGGSLVTSEPWDFPIIVCDKCVTCQIPAFCDLERPAVCRPGQDGERPECATDSAGKTCK